MIPKKSLNYLLSLVTLEKLLLLKVGLSVAENEACI